jgi:hypothetical protein
MAMITLPAWAAGSRRPAAAAVKTTIAVQRVPSTATSTTASTIVTARGRIGAIRIIVRQMKFRR